MRVRLTVVAAALTLGAILAHAQTSPRSDSGGSSSISGTVVRHGTTELVEGAAVVLIDDLGLGPNRTFNTTASGAFKFDGLRAGRYELAATKPGSVRGAYGADKPERIGRQIVLATDQHIENLRVPIFAGAVVAGTVWSPDNLPVRRVRVTALRQRHLSGGRTTIATEASASTDDRGRFRIFGVPPDDYVIAAMPASLVMPGQPSTPPTFFPSTSRFDAAQRLHVGVGEERLDTDIRLVPAPAGSLRIQVRSEDDTSLADRRVLVSVESDNQLTGVSGLSSLTGTDVIAGNLAPGPYRVAASVTPTASPGPGATALSGYTLTSVTESGQQQAVVVVKRMASVTGTVSVRSVATPPRMNVGSTRVWLTALDTNPDRPRYDTPSNVISQFTLPAIPAGRYRIDALATVAGGALQPWTLRTVARNGQALAQRVIDIKPDDAAPVDLELTLVDDLAVFSGSLIAAGSGSAPPHFVVLIARDPASPGFIPAYYARPAIDGTFRIGCVLDGTYAVAVVEDVRPDDLNDSEFLDALRKSAIMTVTLAPGEEKRQSLQVR